MVESEMPTPSGPVDHPPLRRRRRLAIVIAVPLAALCVFAIVKWRIDADKVRLQEAVQQPAVVSHGQPSTFTFRLQSPNAERPVTVDVELFDAQNQRVYQSFFEQRTLPADAPAGFTVDVPVDIMPGSYWWSVGLFTPDWKQRLQWFHEVAGLDVR